MKFNRIQNILLFTYVLAISYISFFNAPIKTRSSGRYYRSGGRSTSDEFANTEIFEDSIFNPRLDTFRLLIMILVLSIITLTLLILIRNINLKLELIRKSIKNNQLIYIVLIIAIITSAFITWGKYNNDKKFFRGSASIDTTAVASDTAAVVDTFAIY